MIYSGFQVIEDSRMTEGPFEDWSDVRSPARAARRRKRGHRQRIRLYFKPSPNMIRLPNGVMVGHPATVDALRRAVADRGYGE